MAAVNITELTQGANVAEWFVIVNSWSQGLLMGGLLAILFLIVFSISKKSGTEDTKAFMGTSFALFLISSVGWFVRFNDMQLVTTFFPMFFLFMSGLGILFVVLGDRIFSTS